MSRKSLKQQLDGKPQKKPKAHSDKWAFPTMIIVLAVLLVLILAIGGVALARYMRGAKQGVDSLPELSYSEQQSPYSGSYGAAGGTAGAYQVNGAGTAGTETAAGPGGSFQYGTVSGTTYRSAFSGITFTAPSNWKVTGGTQTGQSSSTAVMDLDASNPDGTMSVKMEYFSKNGGQYGSSGELLAALKSSITTSKDDIHLQIGGRNFEGFLFRGKNGGKNAYSEILATEVDGYILVLQIIAPKTSDITTILNMFS